MKQLSGSDSMFLTTELKGVHNHVACLMVYDVTTAPKGQVRFKDILKHFDERMYLHPIFRRRLAMAPFGIDRPYWIEESEIDVEFHIRHIALPKPGDWRQLMIQVARLHSRPLDRSRPLWEAYIIEGLDNIPNLPPGSFAMFIKMHHASVDGMAAIHLAQQMHALSPDAEVDTERKPITVDRDPLMLEYVSRALNNGLRRVSNMARLSQRSAAKVIELSRERIGTSSAAPADPSTPTRPLSAKAPATRFAGRVSPHRVLEGFGMPLSRIKRVRSKMPGSTLNDIFMAVAGGAARSYLLAKKELPEVSLVGMMPMSLRSDATSGGNDVTALPVALRSDIADPLERLRAVHREAKVSREQAEKLGLNMLKDVLDVLPGPLTRLFVDKVVLPQANLTVSNVRGPDVPLYLAGAKAMCIYPVSIPIDGVGLNITGVSYNGVMWVSAVSCRNMLPDSGFFLQCMRGAWEELLAAADAMPEPAATAKTAVTPKPAARGTKASPKSKPATATVRAKPADGSWIAKTAATAKPARAKRSSPKAAGAQA